MKIDKEKKHSRNNRLTRVWQVLIALTLVTALLADQAQMTTSLILITCLSFAVKGSLVCEYLIGLSQAGLTTRSLMLAYSLVMALMVALAMLFPDYLVAITTL